MLFDDEFVAPNGTKACPLKWNYEMGGQWANHEQQGYSTDPSYGQIDNDGSGNGYLSINAKKVTYHDPVADELGQNPQYTSARLDTYHNFQFTYGHVEARIWASGTGTWPAFWLLGTACAPTYNASQPAWPACGEIDIMELFSGTPTVERATLHSRFVDPTSLANNRWSVGGTYQPGADLTAGWHTYAADIKNNYISFSMDGHQFAAFCGRLTSMFNGDHTPTGRIYSFDHPWYIVMNVAVGGDNGGDPSTSTYPQSMRVDYVRVWTDPSYSQDPNQQGTTAPCTQIGR